MKIHCEGLSLDEGRELQGELLGIPGIELVESEDILKNERGFTRDSVQIATPHLHLLLKLVEEGVGALATGALSGVGKDLYKQVGSDAVGALGKWLKVKFQGKNSASVRVTIYGPNGQVIKTFDQNK